MKGSNNNEGAKSDGFEIIAMGTVFFVVYNFTILFNPNYVVFKSGDGSKE